MSEHLDQFLKQAINVLDNISAHFRLLRDRIDPTKFQDFCEQILQLARKVHALRHGDGSIPDNDEVHTLARQASNDMQRWFELFGNGVLHEPPPDTGRIRHRGALLNPSQAFLEAVSRLSLTIKQSMPGTASRDR